MTLSLPVNINNGGLMYNTKDFKKYILIGTLKNGKKFRSEYSDHSQAECINMWQGRMYGVTFTGKKVLLKTVTN